MQGGRDVDIGLFGVLVAYPVPEPVASDDLELLQSRVHQVTAEELERLGVTGHQFEGRTKVLFVKVLRKMMQKWKNSLKNIVLEVLQNDRL